jgi:hypothetical protein
LDLWKKNIKLEKKLHHEMLHNLYSSSVIIRVMKLRKMRWEGHVVRMEETRSAYKILVGKREGKRPAGISERRWKDNIKMNLRQIGCEDGDWIYLAQNRDQWRDLVKTVANLRVP